MQTAIFSSFYLFYILMLYLGIALITFPTVAAGWEFGIRDRYIKFLTGIFEFGKRQIETTDQSPNDETDTDNEGDAISNSSSGSNEQKSGNNQSGETLGAAFKRPNFDNATKQIENRTKQHEHVSETNNNNQTNGNHDKDDDLAKKQVAPFQQQRVRKQSTIKFGGPPVFLLDEESDDRQQEFYLSDVCIFIQKGIAAIFDDEVTKCFDTEELSSWNLLTRNNRNYHFSSLSLSALWAFGFTIRYFMFFPLRAIFTTLGLLWLIMCTFAVGCLPARIRGKAYWGVSLMCFRVLSCGITAVLKFHNRQYRANSGDICVANHTSPIDVVVLASDNCYALVGQKHGGLLGLLERALSRAATHVWFDRSEMRDRQFVVDRLKEHVTDKSNLPILIFPEGTCINNSAVMMFKKGSFEASDRVCPVAIKYDQRFGDPFWNSSRQGWVQYLLLMMTSWAIKCDVWYLPPMVRQEDEDAVGFANRVKSEIARQGGLVDLAWDGQLKRTLAKSEWREKQQEDYSRRLKID